MEIFIVVDCEYEVCGAYSSFEKALESTYATKEEIEDIFQPMAGIWKVGDPTFTITKCKLEQ